MGGSERREIEEILEGQPRAAEVESRARHLSAEDGDHLEIDQLRRCEPLRAQMLSRRVTVDAVVGQCGGEDAGVKRRARSARTARAAALSVREPPARAPARASTSSTVGRLASSINRVRRYSCSDCRASAARRRRTAWVSSGTSLICTLGMAPF